jgi:hypothetical protein
MRETGKFHAAGSAFSAFFEVKRHQAFTAMMFSMRTLRVSEKSRLFLVTLLSCRTPSRGGHPHIHYLVPGGGLSRDGCQWVASRRKFLLHHDPLADHFRNLFRRRLEKHAPAALPQIAPKVWRQRWVVDVQAVGNGENALRYLGRYVFHTATGNRRLPRLPDGHLRWTYRDSQTHQLASVDLEPFELIRRFLQHVLPAGYSRVRYFGWLSPAAR